MDLIELPFVMAVVQQHVKACVQDSTLIIHNEANVSLCCDQSLVLASVVSISTIKHKKEGPCSTHVMLSNLLHNSVAAILFPGQQSVDCSSYNSLKLIPGAESRCRKLHDKNHTQKSILLDYTTVKGH